MPARWSRLRTCSRAFLKESGVVASSDDEAGGVREGTVEEEQEGQSSRAKSNVAEWEKFSWVSRSSRVREQEARSSFSGVDDVRQRSTKFSSV